MDISLLLRSTCLVVYLTSSQQVTFGQILSTPPVLVAETARFAAMTAADTTALRDMLHPDLLYIHSNGLEESADDLVASVAAGKIVYESFEPQQKPRVLVFSKTALVDGLVRVSGLYQGNVFVVDLRYTSVYRKAEGQWRLIRWQSLGL